METTVLRAAEPADLLAVIPFRLGFQPRDSIVIVLIDRTRVGVTVRVDRAQLVDDDAGRALVAWLGTVFEREGGDGTVIVRFAEDAGAPRRDRGLRAVLREAARASAWVECYDVGAATYREHCPRSLAPLGPARPVAEIADSPLVAAQVFAGETTLADRSDITALPAATEDARRRAGRAADRSLDQRTAEGPDGLGRWRREGLAEFVAILDTAEDALEDGGAAPPVEDAALGRIAALLVDPAACHGVCAAILSRDEGAEGACARAESGGLGEGAVAGGGALADGGAGERGGSLVDWYFRRPGWARAEAANEILTRAAARAKARHRAGLFALLAWLAWWSGDGGRTWGWLDRVAACPQTPGLATLVADLAARGASPASPVFQERLRAGWVNGGAERREEDRRGRSAA